MRGSLIYDKQLQKDDLLYFMLRNYNDVFAKAPNYYIEATDFVRKTRKGTMVESVDSELFWCVYYPLWLALRNEGHSRLCIVLTRTPNVLIKACAGSLPPSLSITEQQSKELTFSNGYWIRYMHTNAVLRGWYPDHLIAYLEPETYSREGFEEMTRAAWEPQVHPNAGRFYRIYRQDEESDSNAALYFS